MTKRNFLYSVIALIIITHSGPLRSGCIAPSTPDQKALLCFLWQQHHAGRLTALNYWSLYFYNNAATVDALLALLANPLKPNPLGEVAFSVEHPLFDTNPRSRQFFLFDIRQALRLFKKCLKSTDQAQIHDECVQFLYRVDAAYAAEIDKTTPGETHPLGRSRAKTEPLPPTNRDFPADDLGKTLGRSSVGSAAEAMDAPYAAPAGAPAPTTRTAGTAKV